MTNDSDDSTLGRASRHLETARRLGTELSSKKMWAASRLRPMTKAIDQVADELAAAIDLVASAVAAERARTDKTEAAHRLLDQSVTRLELVTAGDEQLIDDLGAAIEAAQIELKRLERQHDLLRSRLDANS
ncbi:MAG: hypothetical protein NZ609_07980 [Acidimicrobiales bacterium]|jgi:uncharacterized coiled-coil protein SlyX|nr:hypothetical protein [Acidimicrobiales bacterium]